LNKIKKVLITGANDGIGFALVQKYLSERCNVVAQYHTSNHNLISLESKQLTIVSGDFSSIESIGKFTDSISEHGIDIVINNAARYSVFNQFANVPDFETQMTFAVNFLAPVRIISAALPKMLVNRWGRVVNISSIGVASGGSPGSFHYTASKAAIESFTKTIAPSVASDNVLINAIRLGVTDTSIHKRNPCKNMDNRVAKIPIGRMATRTEVSEFIYYLGSDHNTYSTATVHTFAGGE